LLNNINAKSTCELFRIISKRVWDKIIFHHLVNTEVPEIGLTNDIIATLRNYSRRNGEIGIWANNGWNEKEYGSDIDVFIERSKGKFVWYAMQAKVLKIKKNYDIMSKHQWEMLNHLNELSGCMTKFLLYNGVSDFKYSGKDVCNNKFYAHQFGCSLVKPEVVRILSENSNPKFNDFHPNYAQPWRSIVCCNNNDDSTLFTSWQIRNAIRYYPIMLTEIDLLAEYSDDIEEDIRAERRDLINIKKSNEDVGRSPKYAIVIKNSFRLANPKKETLKLSEENINIPILIGKENEKKERI